MYNITHIFEVGDNKYALDWRNIIFCRLDQDWAEKFQNCINNLEERATSSFDTFFNNNIFASNCYDLPIPKYKHNRLNISFAPIHECNFACKYCFAHENQNIKNVVKMFDKSTIDRLLEYIFFDEYKNFDKYKFDFVGGGEPLLNFDILEYFLKKVRNIEKNLGKEISILIVTNSTLLTPEILSKLDKYDVHLGISFDGNKEVHNSQRIYKDGSGTYDDVVKSILMLRSSNASEKLKGAWAMSVITPNTKSLIDLMENCINLGFRRMQMQLLRIAKEHPLRFDCNSIIELKNNYSKLIAHIVSFAQKGDYLRLKMILNDNDSFGKIVKRLLLRKQVFYRCFAGRNKISISPDGFIYPCDSFCGKKDYVLGSIYSDKKEKIENSSDIFLKLNVRDRTKCSKCWARYLCGGDCYYNSLNVNGDIYQPDNFVCEMNKFFIEQAVDLLIKLYMIDKNSITKLVKFLNVN